MRKPKKDPAEVRVFLLDYLQHGPANLEELYADAFFPFGFSKESVQAAMQELAITSKRRPQDGAVFVMRPHNVVAIWWAKPATAHRVIGTASGGNAA